MKWLAAYLTFSLIIAPMTHSLMLMVGVPNYIMAEICGPSNTSSNSSVQFIKIDLGPSKKPNDTPLPPQSKACHAVCCSREDGGELNNEDDLSV